MQPMQPCTACGGVINISTGRCGQCGAVWTPAVARPAPGHGPPTSGPGYPSSPAAAGHAPPGYPPAGGYPPGYPPPVAPDPGRRARPFVIPLVALSATLVVLVIAIVIVVVVRSGDDPRTVAGPDPTTAADPAVAADVDECVVGTWEVTYYRETVNVAGISQPLVFTGGQGATVELGADGSGTTRYQRATYESTVEGQPVLLELDGTVTYKFSARNGTVSFRDMTTDVTATIIVDSQSPVTERMDNNDDPAKYTCAGRTLTQKTSEYETQLRKVS